MAPDYIIKFHNHSDVALNRVECFYPTFSTGPARPVTIPTDHLHANGGLETLGWEVILQDLASGPYDGAVAWRHPTTNHLFGVQIHVPVQIFHIGTSPYYQVRHDNGDGSSNYYTPVEEAGKAWDFPEDWSKASGLKVRVDPVAGGQKLEVNVTISKYKA
ncbi:hypothetical protein B0H17DRAFT_1104032 [Mycena rosella]|uniref:Uncharacterized protein n=1 Tax=Mycena rosella TaxID=1033263 RepID=A0AAD7FVR2_MYCRO|nr:hypothetical protein B0H17DRAFT_1104032 [Mycena rosella]